MEFFVSSFLGGQGLFIFACGFDVLSSAMLDGGELRLSCLVLSCFFVVHRAVFFLHVLLLG
ncbi:hypothetical protein GGI42DRAFT_332302, partial [Trichoderma sp. SZMC 28013]